MSDGIAVILDQWDLKDGQDLNDFMEQMVKDPQVKRVVIISDSAYAEKANSRKGGVGTETQIISKEVYESVDQTKFVPVLRERDTDGKPCLPIYLKSRKFIDFSNADDDAVAYDQLLRNIYERPRRPKPTLGKAPSHLFDDTETVVSSAQKAKRFRETVANGRGNPIAAFSDFVDEFLENFAALRMTYRREEADTWCARIRANIDKATAHREVFVDVVKAGVQLPAGQFVLSLIDLLEKILPFQERPEGIGSFFECSEDNYKLLCYEFFLYSIAAFIKAKRFNEARQLIDHRYVSPRTYGGNDLEGHSYEGFNMYAISLEETCALQGDQKRSSVMADLIHDRATNKYIKFSDVLQADVVLCLAARGVGWFPRCLVYGRSAGKLELFVRAATKDGFAPLRILLRFETPQELLQHISSPNQRRLLQSDMFWFSTRGADCLNLEELEHRWGGRQVE